VVERNRYPWALFYFAVLRLTYSVHLSLAGRLPLPSWLGWARERTANLFGNRVRGARVASTWPPPSLGSGTATMAVAKDCCTTGRSKMEYCEIAALATSLSLPGFDATTSCEHHRPPSRTTNDTRRQPQPHPLNAECARESHTAATAPCQRPCFPGRALFRRGSLLVQTRSTACGLAPSPCRPSPWRCNPFPSAPPPTRTDPCC